MEMSPRPQDSDHRQAYAPWPDTSDNGHRQEKTPVRPSMATIPKSLYFDGHQSSSWLNFRFKFLGYVEFQKWNNPTRLKAIWWCLSGKASDTFQEICEHDHFASFEEVLAKIVKQFKPQEPPKTAFHEFLSARQD